jgi:hypothetical protein
MLRPWDDADLQTSSGPAANANANADAGRAAALSPVRLTRPEFELECIREFAHSGVQLGAGVSREERRERIRASILREAKEHDRWRGTAMTYAAMYRQIYNRSLDEGQPREEKRAPAAGGLQRQAWGPLRWDDDPALDDPDDEPAR